MLGHANLILRILGTKPYPLYANYVDFCRKVTQNIILLSNYIKFTKIIPLSTKSVAPNEKKLKMVSILFPVS